MFYYFEEQQIVENCKWTQIYSLHWFLTKLFLFIPWVKIFFVNTHKGSFVGYGAFFFILNFSVSQIYLPSRLVQRSANIASTLRLSCFRCSFQKSLLKKWFSMFLTFLKLNGVSILTI